MEADSILVAPSAGLLVWAIWAALILTCAPIAMAKGRWGMVLGGFLTLGFTWVLGSIVYAMPGSIWFKHVYSDMKRRHVLRLTGRSEFVRG